MPTSKVNNRRVSLWLFLLLLIILLAWTNPLAENQTARRSMSFAVFTDTHVGQSIRSPKWGYAEYLDRLALDVMDNTLPCDFVVHLGDAAYDNTAFVNGVGLPESMNRYQNNFNAFLLSHLNLPFHFVGGNIDLVDYEDEPGLPVHDDDPFVLLRTYVDETELNHYPYAMMRDGILFLTLPEMDYEMWTRPALYEWVQFMTTYYHDATTIIFSHQAIEDTTPHDGNPASTYRGQQDQAFWAELFRNNPQIKMWIHGHNHMAGWYQGSRSSGASRPVQDFGHEMVFSAPYAQMDWGNYLEEDTIVIYTISADGISARAWENNGSGGHWVSGYDNTWMTPTTYNPDAEDWYSFPAILQDGETQVTDMKVLSSRITLQLIGTGPVELFCDPRLETKGSHVHENIIGFDDDLDSVVIPTTPGMTVKGPAKLTFPPKHEWDKYCHDGRGGQPYHYFSVGTTPAAVPGGSYTFTMTAKSESGNGRVILTASASDWGTKSQYSTLAGSSREVFSHRLGSDYETVTGTYVVPAKANAWFLQGILDFVDPTNYDVAYFSIKRTAETETTDDFQLTLSGHTYKVAGPLGRFQTKEFSVPLEKLADQDGRITFKASIKGNHFGMARLIYHAPLLMGRSARYRVDRVQGNTYHLTLTKRLSGYSTTFKMFPFSPKYGIAQISTEDGSGKNHVSKNGNHWVACDCSTAGKKIIITYPAEKKEN